MKIKINNIYVDGWERFVEGNTPDNRNITVHFLEYSEYITQYEISKKKKIGDVLEGDIRIDLVTHSFITKDKLMFIQPIKESSHIRAIIEVENVEDDYSIYARTNICDKNILVEFERKVQYNIGDRLYLEGSLEIDLDMV